MSRAFVTIRREFRTHIAFSKSLLYLISCLSFLFSSIICISQNTGNKGSSTNWDVNNPFGQKAFIENKGQFNEKKINNILFGASIDGLDLYFNQKGLIYKHDEMVTPAEKGEEEEEDKKMKKIISHFLSIEWGGANPNAEIIAETPVSFYYTYGGVRMDGSTIKAHAFKKITYKNCYPNIDVEYIFPENKTGIKYNIILHPGADVSVIKMHYKHAKELLVDTEGNLIIKSELGNFIDHAPISYNEAGEKIKTTFEINGSNISFKFSDPLIINSGQSTITIDPWVTNPAFSGFNSAFDINYDLKGNVYVHGSYPVKLQKINSAGIIQWTFTANGFGNGCYGDFAEDEVTGTSYLVEGSSVAGSRVFKINTSGVQTGTFPGNTDLMEMWRAEYNRCINKIVIGGGDYNTTNQAAIMDTNLISITPVNVLSAGESCHDISLLTVDDNNFCYMGTAKRLINSNFDNQIIKCPIPNLLPLSFSIKDGHTLGELSFLRYLPFSVNGNGMNGMAVSPNWLYTYDSDSLKRWDKNTGAFISGIHVSPVPAIYGNGANPVIAVRWGGITVDECDNIYLGVANTIKEYNTSLTLVNTFALPDTAYDVKLGLNGKLYACGKAFVKEMIVPVNNLSATSTASSCSLCSGTATANLSCGNVSAYSWSTSPKQTTQIATGLCPGNYTVTATTGCFNSYTASVTVSGNSSTIILSTSVAASSCNASGTATVTASGGALPYTYSWNTSPVQTTPSAISLTAGTYIVTVTDASGCTQTQTAIVPFSSPVVSIASQTNNLCNGATTGSVSVSGSGGTGPYTYSWNTIPVQTGTTAMNLSAGTYIVTLSDLNGCSHTQSVTITEPQAMLVSIQNTDVDCFGAATGAASASCAGGTSPYTYSWNTTPVQTGITAINLAAGSYTVIVTDSNMCSMQQTITIMEPATAVSVTTNITNIDCNKGNIGVATADAIGGTGPYTYLWNTTPLQTGKTAGNLAAGNYVVTVTDGNGCIQTQSALITSLTNPLVTADAIPKIITNGDNSQLTSGGNGTYYWTPSSTLSCSNCPNPIATPTVTTTYCILMTSIDGCMDSACVTVQIEMKCEFEELFVPNGFSPNADGQNDILFVRGGGIEEMYWVIYDRWGEKVFETIDPKQGWDGTYNGAALDPAVFIYYLKATCYSGEEIIKKGNVAIIK